MVLLKKFKDEDKTCGHCIPHHATKKESTTTSIHVVYDCSCKAWQDMPSLKECLETGPSLVLNDMSTILLGFCANNIALTSDIEKAFLNIQLDKSLRIHSILLAIRLVRSGKYV